MVGLFPLPILPAGSSHGTLFAFGARLSFAVSCSQYLKQVFIAVISDPGWNHLSPKRHLPTSVRFLGARHLRSYPQPSSKLKSLAHPSNEGPSCYPDEDCHASPSQSPFVMPAYSGNFLFYSPAHMSLHFYFCPSSSSPRGCQRKVQICQVDVLKAKVVSRFCLHL